MSDLSQKPISSLAKEHLNECARNDHHGHHARHNNWWFYLFWFLVIGVIAWFLLFALKPDFVQKKDKRDNVTGEVDQGKVLTWAVVLAVAAVVLIWLFQYAMVDE